MAKNALVLGGGGVLGISWEIGVLQGLAEAGVDVTGADLVVGTSAGSVVGTRIAQGTTLDALVAEQYEPSDGQIEANMQNVDLPKMMMLFAKWAAYPEMTQETCREVGADALAAKTGTQEEWIAWFQSTLQPHWPERDLRLTAVDAHTGEFAVWTRESGVDIATAVASSCAVPGLFPCVGINGSMYQDGGVRSGTNADIAAGYGSVLMIAPIGAGKDGIDPLLGRTSRAEAQKLSAAGTNVELVFCDEASLAVIGINRMDTSKRGATAEAGIAQGKALAGTIESAWSRATA